MTKLTKDEFDYIENWLMNKGRDIEVAQFNYLFNNQECEMVLHALTLYQNKDGGFGHGLEPDCLNPNSSPIQTWYALSIIKSVGYKKDMNDEFLNDILNKAFRYLYTKVELVDYKWPYSVVSNNDYPCAIWWKHDDKKLLNQDYNPTAAILGYTLYFLDENNKFYKKAYSMIKEAFTSYLNREVTDKHEISCYITLIECLKELNINYPLMKEVESKIYTDANRIIEKNPDNWSCNYPNMPLDLFEDKTELSDEMKTLIELNLDYIIDNRKANGLWEINWTWWNDYPEYEVSRIKWSGILAVKNLTLLKKFNRIEGI